ncbi:MAG: HYR domain-containing protein [Phycisphaerae bacterium]|nr:HYR domain-containing protein [Phycisphaerae bacterium]
MARVRSISIRFARLLICLCIPSLGACHLVYPHHPQAATPPTCTRYECRTDVVICGLKNRPLDVEVTLPDDSSNCYSPKPAYVEEPGCPYPGSTDPACKLPGFGLTQKVYCDANWTVKDISHYSLSGCLYIRPRYADRKNKAKEFLAFKVLNAAESLYVAYDSKPNVSDWLKADPDYAPFLDENGNQVYITLTKNKDLKLSVWKHKKAPAANDKFTLPGNLYGNGSTSDVAMYFVLMKPAQEPDCSKPVKLGEHIYHNCGDAPSGSSCLSQEQVKQDALNACKEYLKKNKYTDCYFCTQVNATKFNLCSDPEVLKKEFELEIKPLSFPRSCEVEFDPNTYVCQASVRIAGRIRTPKIKGTLHFETSVDELRRMTSIKINSMILQADNMVTDDITFSNVVIALHAPATAECTDADPPYQQPCDAYQIPANQFIVGVDADDDEGTVIVDAMSEDALDIQIDNQARTFRITGGPISGELPTDDGPLAILVSIDLMGHIRNLAPHARGDESDKGSECKEGKNSQDIWLDASNSFKIYKDPLPTDPNSYLWYENLGAVTQRLLGKGQKLKIGAYELSFGVHHITLVLRDEYGIADTDTFTVEVWDTVAPTIQAPPGCVTFVQPDVAGPVQVDLGEPDVSGDACSNEVMITNDAPDGLLFPLGETLVTWTADDGTGNAATSTQKVVVLPFGGGPSLKPDLKAAAAQIKDALDASSSAIADCRGNLTCMRDLSSLLASINHLSDVLAARTAPAGEEELCRLVLDKLDAAETVLMEADTQLETADGAKDPQERATLRAVANQYIQTASDLMGEIMAMADGGGVGTCFIATAAYGSPMAPDVLVLRDFRDRYLLTNAPGRWLASAYYRCSPPVARVIAGNDSFRLSVRCLLAPIVWSIKHPMGSVALSLCVVTAVYRRRRLAALVRNRVRSA